MAKSRPSIMADQGAAPASHGHQATHRPYVRLALMAVLSFIVMYGLMYAMVDVTDNVFNSLNQAYMAGLMTAPMILIELALMRSMYQSPRLNVALAALALIFGIFCWVAIRTQLGIGDTQFLRSMIPHHAGAILMCEKASVNSEDIRGLCQQIKEGQAREIEQMKALLAR